MKKTSFEQQQDDDIRSEYDFRQAVRGLHYRPIEQGYTIKIHKTDGTIEEQHILFEPGTIRLDPDVSACFPDAQAVNQALRSLMAIARRVRERPKTRRVSQASAKPAAQK